MEFLVAIFGGLLGGLITVVAVIMVLMGEGPEGEGNADD